MIKKNINVLLIILLILQSIISFSQVKTKDTLDNDITKLFKKINLLIINKQYKEANLI